MVANPNRRDTTTSDVGRFPYLMGGYNFTAQPNVAWVNYFSRAHLSMLDWPTSTVFAASATESSGLNALREDVR